MKTPIALIQGYAEGLVENVAKDEESKKFYAEVILDESNKMDLTPFLEIDLENIKESAILSIKKFCKSEFDKDSIFSIASELKYTTLIKELFKSELENPSDDFTKLMISSIYNCT